jgi:hypothetical protein
VIIGLPEEIKDNEYRVGLTPAGVRALTDANHKVVVEKNAGEGSGFENELYQRAGATILDSADQVWAEGEMIVKVKEPIAPEYPRMREGQLLFTYLHLAPDNELTEQLLKRKVTGVAYETITDRRGTLPLLTPMSEVAGPHGDPGWRALSGKDERRPRHSCWAACLAFPPRAWSSSAAEWSARTPAKIAVGHGRARNDHRQQSRPIARTGRHFSLEDFDARFERLHDS